VAEYTTKALIDEALCRAQAALTKGDVSTAEALCKSVIDRKPTEGRAFSLLAETALLRGIFSAAVACANRSVTLAPSDPIAHIMLAKANLFSGEIIRALSVALTALPLVGESAEAADALGAILGLLGRHTQALELSIRAVALRPDVVQFLFNLAATERMLGKLEDAERHCNSAISLKPEYAIAYYVRSDLRKQSERRNHINEIESALNHPGLHWRDKVLLRYALAKECEDIGADGLAFDHVMAGARLWRQNTPFDPSAELACIDQIIETQTRSWLGQLPRGNESVAPIFVCGLPRTGTTLIERLIASHSAVVSIGETNIFPTEKLRIQRAGGAGSSDFRTLGERYLDVVRVVHEPRTIRFVDKTLQNYLHCGTIFAALPRAKIIVVERDAMDCAWALFKAHFRSGFLFSYDLEELADYYRAYISLVDHWSRTLSNSTLMRVKYEDVVLNTRAECARILAFLGLPWEEQTLNFYQSTAPSATASAVQVRQPIYASSVGKWRRHTERLDTFRQRLGNSSSS
jgi:tetratricopeptide (TPR) repeat protein